MPANLEVTPSSYSTLRVSWDAAPGATQYMILYSALNHGEPDDAKEVGPGPSFSLLVLCVIPHYTFISVVCQCPAPVIHCDIILP